MAHRIASRAGYIAFREQYGQCAGRRGERRYSVHHGYVESVHPTGAGRGEAYRYREMAQLVVAARGDGAPIGQATEGALVDGPRFASDRIEGRRIAPVQR